ncbi:serine hydrolase [Cellulosilyticum ruminicola]|uniref:serine hydrolase n=1 Tax=Cellulosilyticum ruminicola TaxID=425254 RepID=UPI0006D18B0D|nr:serine hydrolase [Cellulosilyticum ruminicola]
MFNHHDDNYSRGSYTKFKIASISKAVTAYGVMQLVDERVLDLDKPVNDYLTRYKITDDNFAGNKVILRILLSHTSGIRGDMEKIYEGTKPDVATALSNLIEYIPTMEKNKYVLDIDLPKQVVIGWWDEIRLRRVIHNIIDNDLKYGMDGKKIKVQLKEESN